MLELHDATGTLVATNDNWTDNYNEQEIIDTGIAPVSPNESVILGEIAFERQWESLTPPF